MCRLHIYDANLPFHHIPKVLYWIDIWWLWRLLENSELIVMFKKPVWDDLSFLTWCIILLEVAIRRWVHCGHTGMDISIYIYIYSGFLPLSKNMHVRLIGVSKIVLRSVCERVCGCLSLLALCGPVMDWRHVQGIPSRPMTAGIGSRPPATRPTD